mmetsp:Transcript_52880/g.120544  ORF Transcript_52880/g.120544 Transcript_52880/m.120544 type:complete len:253 (+) Transcript_52880:26-784(+)
MSQSSKRGNGSPERAEPVTPPSKTPWQEEASELSSAIVSLIRKAVEEEVVLLQQEFDEKARKMEAEYADKIAKVEAQVAQLEQAEKILDAEWHELEQEQDRARKGLGTIAYSARLARLQADEGGEPEHEEVEDIRGRSTPRDEEVESPARFGRRPGGASPQSNGVQLKRRKVDADSPRPVQLRPGRGAIETSSKPVSVYNKLADSASCRLSRAGSSSAGVLLVARKERERPQFAESQRDKVMLRPRKGFSRK